MLMVPTELRSSSIHGIGVFLLAPIKKGDLIWRFDSRVDRIYSQGEVDSLPGIFSPFIKSYALWHKPSKVWLICGDYASFINHADNPVCHSLGAVFNDDIAAHDAAAGTELTADYRTVCDYTLETGSLAVV